MKQHTASQPGARSKGCMPDSPRAHRRKPASPPSSPPRRKVQKAGHAYFWTKEEDRLLAKALKSWQRTSGRELARRLGRSVVAVENRRRLKFGRVQPTPRPWKRSEERYLGIRMDPEVARLIGRHPAVVAEHRRQLGIPAVRRRRAWTRAEDRLLGTLPDPAVGKRIGRLASTVGHRRRKLRITRHPPPGAFTPEEDRLLGTMSDPETARRLHRSLASVLQRRQRLKRPAFVPCRPWTPREDALLGKRPDKEVCRRLGRGMAGVIRRRRILGIHLEEWSASNARSGIVRKWTAAEKRLLGTMPDGELARKLGRRYQSVARMRNLLQRPRVRPAHYRG